MPHTGVLRWLQIDTADPEIDTITAAKSSVFNVTSNSTTANRYNYQPQPLILKQESNETDLSQVNIIVTSFLLFVVLLHCIFKQSRKAGFSGIFALSCLIMTALIAPIVGSILFVLACYRQCVLTILKATCKRGTFGGLMKGNDAFWALEEDSSRSIINILALADFNFIVEASNYGEEPLRTVQGLIEDRLLSPPHPFPKLLYHRRQSLGYFYWEKQPYIDVHNHVRWMDIIDENGYITERTLKNYVSALSNSPLPANHSSGWEILIGRHPVLMENDNINTKKDPLDIMETGCDVIYGTTLTRYPVLFRVHHSLGDGVALVRLLLDALADPCTRTPSRTSSPLFEHNNIPSILINNSEIEENQFYKSTYLDIPTTTINENSTNNFATIKKSASCNFEGWNDNFKPLTTSTSLGDCVRAACRKFINLIEETNQLNRLQYQTQSLQNINVVINDQPASTFDNDNKNIFDIINNSKSTDITITTTSYDGNTKNHHYVTRQDCKKFNKLFVEQNIDEEFDELCRNNMSNHIINFIKEKYKFIKNILYHLAVLSLLPATVMNQVITRTFDENPLHGPKLSGYKVVGWYLENEEDEDKTLMSMIKRIRIRTGAHFSDVLLTALSNSFETYFKRFNEVPSDLTVVIPARMGRPDHDKECNAKVSTATIKSKEINAKITKLYLDRNAKRNHSVLYESSKSNLDNKFSVALLTLPIASKTNNDNKLDGLFTKLKRVQKHTNVLRKSADYIVNYWILNVVATLFPIPILRNMVKSTQSSLVVSNMPGPQNLAKLAGHSLHNIVFWVPNRETTGVGVTILSYSGRLQLGIIADRALIPCSEEAQLIVNGIVDTIKKMDQLSSANNYSPSTNINNTSPTPTIKITS